MILDNVRILITDIVMYMCEIRNIIKYDNLYKIYKYVSIGTSKHFT